MSVIMRRTFIALVSIVAVSITFFLFSWIFGGMAWAVSPTLTATQTATATSTPVLVSAAASTTTILRAGGPGHVETLNDLELVGITANTTLTVECCTSGSNCATNCAVLDSSLTPSSSNNRAVTNGADVCASALQDLCLIVQGGGVAGNVTASP
jgi:hypothetical protein